jgi:hypothetical protein
MKLARSIAAAMGLAASIAFLADAPRSARADDDFSGSATVTATQNGKKVDILIKPSKDKLFINSEYPIKVTLSGKNGGSVSKATLGKDDATYVPSDHDGKAKSVSFSVDAPSGLSGEAKLVVCSLDGCGNPTKFPFETK